MAINTLGLVGAGGAWRFAYAPGLTGKSFLVLFFKKERLSWL